ncbi:hypothetical protein LCGC14_0757570 [marine sediment metagenome]|uniref:S-adenosylmethionine decarboxylase proenzyme n=1 Tax=marine sediment metagenome TaxID=412755 RepID=A0A0F9Q283_9ZZZZ
MAILIIGGKARRNKEVLHDHDVLREWMPELCRLIGMKPVGDVHIQPYGHWEGGAPSAVQFVEESAILIHTYPERDYIEFVLHSCKAIPGEGPEGGPVTDAIVAQLALDVRERHYLGSFNWRTLSQ